MEVVGAVLAVATNELLAGEGDQDERHGGHQEAKHDVADGFEAGLARGEPAGVDALDGAIGDDEGDVGHGVEDGVGHGGKQREGAGRDCAVQLERAQHDVGDEGTPDSDLVLHLVLALLLLGVGDVFLDGLEQPLNGFVLAVVETLDAVELDPLAAEPGQEPRLALALLHARRRRRCECDRSISLLLLLLLLILLLLGGRGITPVTLPRHVGLDHLQVVCGLVALGESKGVALDGHARQLAIGLLVLHILVVVGGGVAGVGVVAAIVVQVFLLQGGGAGGGILIGVNGADGGHWGVVVAGSGVVGAVRSMGGVLVEMEEVRMMGDAVGEVGLHDECDGAGQAGEPRTQWKRSKHRWLCSTLLGACVDVPARRAALLLMEGQALSAHAGEYSQTRLRRTGPRRVCGFCTRADRFCAGSKIGFGCRWEYGDTRCQLCAT